MKKAVLAVTCILALLVSSLAGTLLVNLAKADPYEAYTYTAPPIISIYAPTENGTFPSNVLLNFTITKSDGWLIWANLSTGNFRNQLYSVDVMLDGQSYRQIVANSYLSSPFIDVEYLDNLTGGTHTLALKTYCEGWNLETHGFWNNRLPYQTYSDMINFTVYASPPEIKILSITNQTYSTSNIPLNFAVNESVSQTSYSLDGQDNVTIAGNATLTGLSSGQHNITVYANDTFGNVGASETINFIVAKPELFPIVTVAVALGASAAVVLAAGLLLYFKKRKKENGIDLR